MGTITQALRTATSGLLVNQRIMDTIAQNVSNVNTEGYSRKIAMLENQALNGTGAGVKISEIIRRVDEGLLKSLRIETADLNALTTQSDYFSRTQDLFGSPEDNTSISHLIEGLSLAAESVLLTPERSLEKTQFIRELENVTLQLAEISSSIQELRLQADQELSQHASTLSELVNDIDQLNDQIIANGAVKRDNTDLRDQRDTKMTQLSELIDIRYFYRSDGDVVIFTSSGSTLVDTVPPDITHTSAASVTPTTTHSEGDFSGFYIGSTSVQANDITTTVRGGRIKGLIDMRDTVLTNLQSQIDQLASDLKTSLNQVHNRGVSFPGGQEFTGTRNFIAPTTQSIKLDEANSVDDVRIMLLDSSGDQSKQTTLNTIMTGNGFTSRGTGGDWNIDDVAATIQSWLRNNGTASATVSVTTNGGMSIALNSSTLNLAFRDEASSTAGATAADAAISFDSDGDGNTDETVSGFANFFGLNDLVVDNLTDNIWESDVKSSTYSVNAGTLTFADSNGTIGTLTVTTGTSLSTIVSEINNSTTLSPKIKAAIINDGSGQRLRISHVDGSNLSVTDAAADDIISDLGFNPSDARVSSSLAVRSDILSTPGLLAVAGAQWDSAKGVAGEYFMSSGDVTVANQMATALRANNSFKVAGGLSATQNSFSRRAAEIIGTNADIGADNESDIESQKLLTDSLEFKQKSESGVNLDEELANLIVYEQAFSAAARVITTINEMFDALERAL